FAAFNKNGDHCKQIVPLRFHQPLAKRPLRSRSRLRGAIRREHHLSDGKARRFAHAISPPRRPPSSAGLGWTLQLRNRWFADSLLEGTGFEPSVPLTNEPMWICCAVMVVGRVSARNTIGMPAPSARNGGGHCRRGRMP